MRSRLGMQSTTRIGCPSSKLKPSNSFKMMSWVAAMPRCCTLQGSTSARNSQTVWKNVVKLLGPWGKLAQSNNKAPSSVPPTGDPLRDFAIHSLCFFRPKWWTPASPSICRTPCSCETHTWEQCLIKADTHTYTQCLVVLLYRETVMPRHIAGKSFVCHPGGSWKGTSEQLRAHQRPLDHMP